MDLMLRSITWNKNNHTGFFFLFSGSCLTVYRRSKWWKKGVCVCVCELNVQYVDSLIKPQWIIVLWLSSLQPQSVHVTEQKVRVQSEDIGRLNGLKSRFVHLWLLIGVVCHQPLTLWVSQHRVCVCVVPTVRVDAVERRRGNDGDFALTQRTLSRVQIHTGCVHLQEQQIYAKFKKNLISLLSYNVQQQWRKSP